MTTFPSHEEWTRLLDATVRFKQLKPWEWTENEDYFAITNPETNETGYCVILGAAQESFGLNVYIGPQAGLYLQELTRPFSGEYEHDTEELLFTTHAITVSFEDRDMLDRQDLAIIREQGMKFRGANAWPIFRSYEPGKSPWMLSGEQARFLTAALEQSIHVSRRFHENPEMYYEHDQTEEGTGEKRLHRVPMQADGQIEWHDEWLPWYVTGKLLEPYIFPDEIKLQQLKKLKKSAETWECDFYYASVTIAENKTVRPYYPRLCLWVHPLDGNIMTAEITPESDCRSLFVQQLILLLESSNIKPKNIETGSTKAFFALKDTADRLGISIGYNPMLEALLNAKEALDERL